MSGVPASPPRSPVMVKVISGGQTGVDQAALRAALALGLECGGWCPPGRQSEAGPIPDVFPLRETPQERSPSAPRVPRSLRSEWNVRDGDATLVLLPRRCDEPAAGTAWTIRCAEQMRRPLLVLDPDAPGNLSRLRDWLARERVGVLNVAGPSERDCPGVGAQAYALLLAALAPVDSR